MKVRNINEAELMDFQLSVEEKGKIRRQNEHELLME